MNNLLPTIKKTITHRADDKNQSWRPDDAHPVTGKVSYFLESEFTKKSTIKITYGQNVLPMKPPNEKHADTALYMPKDMSPLKSAMMDIQEASRLIYIPPPSLTRKTIIKDTSSGNCLILRMINTLPMCMDLFVQKKLTISTTTVIPMRQCTRLIAGTEDPLQKEDEACFWFCTSKRALLSSTNRQELKEFTFLTTQQIGLEVELVEERLVVTQVMADCQATPYQVALLSSELVAVNGARVITMNEFREAMVLAKQGPEVVLQVASYKGGKGKLDNLYAHDFTKSKEVKSLLSNIMMHGLDAEHHRGMTSGGSSTADEEEESQHSPSDHPSRSPSRQSLPSEASFNRGITSEGWEHLEEYPDIEGGNGEYLDTFNEDDEGAMRARRKPGRPAESSRSHAPAPKEEPVREEADDDSSVGSNDSWNKLTKVDEIVTRRSLVCFPAQLGASLQYGTPAKYLQVSNYSTTWNLEVFWVNEDSILSRRAEIAGGTTNYQLFDLDHVWCINATSIAKEHHHHGHNYQPHNYFTSGASLGLGIASEAEEGSPAMLVFRPSKYSLSNNKCTSVLWTPYVSMSITQRLYLSNKTSAEVVPATAIAGVVNPPNFTATPHMHIQVFDGVNKTASVNGQGHSMVRPLSGEVPLDRIKLAKWPRKGSGKRERALRARK